MCLFRQFSPFIICIVIMCCTSVSMAISLRAWRSLILCVWGSLIDFSLNLVFSWRLMHCIGTIEDCTTTGSMLIMLRELHEFTLGVGLLASKMSCHKRRVSNWLFNQSGVANSFEGIFHWLVFWVWTFLFVYDPVLALLPDFVNWI